MIRRLIALSIVLLAALRGMAQDAPKEDKNILELPEFVITGSSSVGIQGAHKQQVKDLWMMDSTSRAALRPVVGTVRGSSVHDSVAVARNVYITPLVAHGQLGVYRTPSGWLHYRGAGSGFDWGVRLTGNATQGSSDHAAASEVTVGAGAGWRLPDNIVEFGNARIGLDFDLHSNAYNLYGSPTPTQQRTVDAKSVRVGIVQEAGTMPFAFDLVTGSDEAKDTLRRNDNVFGVDAQFAVVAPHWTLQGTAFVRGYSGDAVHRAFSSIDVDARYTVAPLRYAFGMGLHTGRTDFAGSHTELAPHASVSYLTGGMEFFGSIARGMRDQTIGSLVAQSPFLDIAVLDSIQYPIDEVDMRIGLRTADVHVLAAEARLAYVRTSNAPVFTPAANGRWGVVYDRTSMLELSGEARWRALPHSAVVVAGALRSTTQASGSGPVPFVPVAEGSVTWNQKFDIPLDLSGTLRIEGRRTGTPDGGNAAPAIALVDLDASYALSNSIAVTAQVRNLLDSQYQIWTNYPGMRIFGALGITARF